MKVQKKEILFNFLTLGYSGYKKAKQLIEANQLKSQVIGSDLLLAFMLVVPILSALGFATMLLEYLEVWPLFKEFDDTGTLIDDSLFGPEIFASQLFGWFPQAFFCFGFLHLMLSLALVQHLPKLKPSDRASIIWFGLYAVDWKPLDYIRTTDVAKSNDT